MLRYFEMRDDRVSPDRWHLGGPIDDSGQELSPWQFFKGRQLTLSCTPQFTLDISGRPLEFCWAAFSVPVVNERFVRLFERLRVQDVQFIPAKVEGHTGPFFILNTLRTLRCIDDARCEEVLYWKPEDGVPEKVGRYQSVAGLRIDPSKVGDARIFRTWGWSIGLIISEDIKLALEREALTGTHFDEV
jgi:hypothetical protein